MDIGLVFIGGFMLFCTVGVVLLVRDGEYRKTFDKSDIKYRDGDNT